MKYLKMFSEMENHQMKLNFETSYVDIKKIYSYTIETGVKSRDHNKWLGTSIVCRSTNNIHYAAPPLDYSDLIDDIRFLSCKKFEPNSKEERELKEKMDKYNSCIKNIETFIPFMLKAFKLAEDGTILKIVIKDNEWELEEVE